MCSLVIRGTFFGVELSLFLKAQRSSLGRLHISLKKQPIWRCSKQLFSLYPENSLKFSQLRMLNSCIQQGFRP